MYMDHTGEFVFCARRVGNNFYISQYEDDKDDVVNRLDDDNDESWFSSGLTERPSPHVFALLYYEDERMGKGIFGYSAKNVNTAMATYVALRAVGIRMLAVSSDLS